MANRIFDSIQNKCEETDQRYSIDLLLHRVASSHIQRAVYSPGHYHSLSNLNVFKIIHIIQPFKLSRQINTEFSKKYY